MDLLDKRALVVGLAREGQALAQFLAGHGACVTVTDVLEESRLHERAADLKDRGVRLVLGGHHPELAFESDLFFVSPGVPEDNPVYAAARDREMPIESMTTLFFALCPGMIAGITGSSGKTTTTSLIGHILREAGCDVVVGGNIGEPMLDLLPSIGSGTLVVLELSSFQLSIMQRSPHVAVVTNISPNHLDRHRSMEEYVAAKQRIVAYQSAADHAVLNATDGCSQQFADATPAEKRWFGLGGGCDLGARMRDSLLGLVNHGEFCPVMDASDVPLLGRHNLENVLAAFATADLFGVRPETMASAVRTFRPAPHRLQPVGEYRGVRFVDDSIATSPARAIVALEALSCPILLIAGGRDKHLPWDEFSALVVRKVRALFLIGEAAPLIEDAVRRQLAAADSILTEEMIRHSSSLEEAVRRAAQMAEAGDVVLLSPGCTSYDMFTNFEERGQAFAQALEALHAA